MDKAYIWFLIILSFLFFLVSLILGPLFFLIALLLLVWGFFAAFVPRGVLRKEQVVDMWSTLIENARGMAEEKGFRAVIEAPAPDGGRVDVGLEQNGRRIACEVSVTSTQEQELSNIKKCLGAGYDTVILCSPEKRILEKMKTLIAERVDQAEREKLLFFQPEELFSYLETEAATLAGKEERVKGYKVKVHYQPLEEEEKKTKREAVAQVILQSLKRQKEK